MPSSDLVFIIGRQRSGTTVLRDLLARHGAVNCDEIFHGDLSKDRRFYSFVLERIKSEPRLVHPESHWRLFCEYVDHQRAMANGQKLIMDVKYFALNLIPQREDVDGRAPYILNFMRNNNAHVFHVIRRNKLRVYVSEEMAKTTGQWSAERPDQLLSQKPKLTVNVGRTLSFINHEIILDQRVQSMLEKVPEVARLFYDAMFDMNGCFSKVVVDEAKRVMDLDAIDPVPGNLKMNPEPLENLVTNFDELRNALTHTPHEWMLFDSH